MQPLSHRSAHPEASDEDLDSRPRPPMAPALLGALVAGLLAVLIVLAVAFPPRPTPPGAAHNTPR